MRAFLERLISPSWGDCLRCHRPWRFAPEHVTQFAVGRGCFPLCERCWQELGTPEARMPFYLALWRRWGRIADWDDIEAAVLAEGEMQHVV